VEFPLCTSCPTDNIHLTATACHSAGIVRADFPSGKTHGEGGPDRWYLVPGAVEACFQDQWGAVGNRWDNPGMKQEMEGFTGRRMTVYSEPLEGQNGNST
jgi:hypothetical protein